MNRFEQAVYDCMIPTAELLAEMPKPLHRAILLNFWRHVHLEGAGDGLLAYPVPGVRSDRADVVIRWNAIHPGSGASEIRATPSLSSRTGDSGSARSSANSSLERKKSAG